MKYILLILLLFVIALILKAVAVKIKSRKLGAEIEHYLKDEQIAYATSLGEMIRCETVSKEGSFNEDEFKKLRAVAKKLFPVLHSKAELLIFGEDCWLYKIEGKDTSRNIMLMSHHDVVAVQGEWEHPGFCGEIHGDAIWGRGTVDTKTSLFAELQALEELLKEGFVPECNIYVGSSHNEEIGGNGIPLVLKFFEENNITLETVLDEGGAIIDPPLAGMKCKCAMMAVHEKGRRRITGAGGANEFIVTVCP